MKNIFHHVHRHITDHHKKYLFGIFGGFAVVKLFLLVIGLSVVQHWVVTNAQLDTWCVLTGEYYTGAYETWCIEIPEELIGGYLIDCETIPGYFTGGTYNESGDLVDQIWIEATESWCVFTGEITIPAYTTWCYFTWWYRTWWIEICENDQDTEDEELGSGDEEQTWTNQTWIIQQQTLVTLWNGICESGDIVWSKPISWSIVRNIFDVQWNYSGGDCFSWLLLQLRDHNNQRISLWTFASGITTTMFDSKKLYSFQQSGLYHILGTNMSGQDYYLYTGTYTWTYSRLFTWYKLRLLTSNQTTIQEIWPFTIDNHYPTLTWLTLTSSWSTTWYLTTGALVTLTFAASEELSWLQVTLWSGKIATSSTVSWWIYSYTRQLTSLFSEWNLAATLSFADRAGNTWALVYTSALVADFTRPVVSGFVFGEYTQWLQLYYSWLETTRYTFTYWTTWWTSMSGLSAEYLTAQYLGFSGIERDTLYTFAVSIFDRAGNTRSLTGNVMRTNLWQIISTISLAPLITESVLTWNLSTLAVILKAEIEKFNACKNALTYTPIELEVRRNSFILQMPDFKKSQVKVLVNAFTLFVLDQIKGDYTIAKSDIEDITKKFDNFLIILKFLRDDDNECKQNLSNYHIGQFQKALEEYKITLD